MDQFGAFLITFWDRFWNSYLQIEAKMGKKEVQNMTPKLTKYAKMDSKW
jgi:hypothetical protein